MFAKSYGTARDEFRERAKQLGAVMTAFEHPSALGPNGQALSIDVARIGAEAPAKVLVICSGTHGVEGFCGSGCQNRMMAEGLCRNLPRSTAVVLVHALNPYGFAHTRRVNEDNVDLNRNFRAHGGAYPPSVDYDLLHPYLIPENWEGPERREAEQRLEEFRRAHGVARYRSAVNGGQYAHRDGLFYGGSAATWSNRTFRKILRSECLTAQDVGFVDLHTGLGPSGHGEIIYIGGAAEPNFQRASSWYGGAVTSTSSGTAVSPPVVGTVQSSLPQELPSAHITPVSLEFGTVPYDDMIEALRGDHWLHERGGLDHPLASSLKRSMRAAFFGETDAWEAQVSRRALEVCRAALQGLEALGE